MTNERSHVDRGQAQAAYSALDVEASARAHASRVDGGHDEAHSKVGGLRLAAVDVGALVLRHVSGVRGLAAIIDLRRPSGGVAAALSWPEEAREGVRVTRSPRVHGSSDRCAQTQR